MKFSQVFSLGKSQAQLDFVDIDVSTDTPLYIDPYAISSRQDIWSQSCQDCILSYFEALLGCVRLNNKKIGGQLLSHLGEPEETKLGVSKTDKGRGIGEIQAAELFDAMAKSSAAKSGLLEDLSDFALFIPSVGRDKISDMTTNIIRQPLIEYTQNQCRLLNIPMQMVSSGFYWDLQSNSWVQSYAELPVYEDSKLILVPKFAVRFQVGVDASSYRRNFVLNFLQAEHLRAEDSLVTVLKNKKG